MMNEQTGAAGMQGGPGQLESAAREEKEQAMARLRRAMTPERMAVFEDTDARLGAYVRGVASDADGHNLFEVLAVARSLEMLDKYAWRAERVRRYFRYYEALKFSGIEGRRRYKLTPVQCFQFANIYGFARKDGTRLCRRAILFVPRKFSKTTSTASMAVHELLFGDANGQTYTGANSYKQAQVCFKEIRQIVRQLDPGRKHFKTNREWLGWKPGEAKESYVECLTAGGDAKDGLAASLFIFDEYAAAYYTRDRSEAAELFQVVASSMGTRREPLVVIITTAGRRANGPFAAELQAAESVLRGEVDDDGLFAHLFMPDAWETGGAALGDVRVWKKCNPHIGVTVRPGFYEEFYKKALTDPESMLEFKSKLLNIFVQDGVRQWVSRQEAVSLASKGFKLDELSNRPPCMISIDLSVSDDLSAVCYSVYDRAAGHFYNHVDYYIPEEAVADHPNRLLYERWARGGWLKLCPGRVVSYDQIVEDVLRRNERVEVLAIGYDKYKAQEVVNLLSAAVLSEGGSPEKVLRAVPNTYGGLNSAVETFEYSIRCAPPRVTLAYNPITFYCFDNAYIDEDKLGNKMPQKRRANGKIDGVLVNLMCFWLWNNYEF